MFTVLAAKRAKRVIAVEAQGRLVSLLRSNLQANNCSDNVDVVFGIIGGNRGVLADRASLRGSPEFFPTAMRSTGGENAASFGARPFVDRPRPRQRQDVNREFGSRQVRGEQSELLFGPRSVESGND